MDPCSIIQQPNKFVLSLDALDLNLLQSAYLSDHSTSTLWAVNKSKGHQNDYFQFEIKSKTEPVSAEVDGTVKDVFTETTICNICNTEVPAAYILDHEDSLKHKAFAKIADVVLERARKHMLKRVNTSDVQKVESTYFCDHCVIVVRNTDRSKHTKSDAHKRSVSFDRLLYDLTTLYTDDHNDIDDTEELTDTNTNFVNTNNKYDRNMVVISDIKASLDKHETKVEMECIEDKINYIRLLDEYDIEKLNTLTPEGDNIRIETQDGYEVIVSEDNFHGFKRIGQKLTQCQVCKVIAKDKEEHKNSETHIRKIVKPFADKNCVRTLDSSWSHCVICNEVIDNSDVHALCNEYHNKLLQKALVAEEDKFVKPKKDKSRLAYYCESCGTTMHVNTVADHLNGYRHNMILKAIEERKKKEEFPDVLKPEKSGAFPPKPPPPNSPKKKKEIPDLLTPKKSDADPPKPPRPNPPIPDETVINDITDLISIKQVEKNGFEHHCVTCNILIHANNIHSHLNGTKHAWNSKSPLHYTMKPVEGSDELMCRVCSVYVVDSLKQIQSHVNTIEHREKLQAFLANNYIMERNNTFYCEPCNVSIMKTNEFYHIERLTHEINLSAHKEEAAKEINDKVNVTYANATDKAAKDNNNDKVNGTKETQHLCHICEVAVPNNPNNIKEHNNGERHKKNMEIVKNELAELSRPSSTTSDICVVNIHHHMEITNNVKQLTCKVCQTAIPNTKEGVHEHVNGLKHKNKYEIILKQNQLTVKNEKHYCDVCKQYIGNEKELVHIEELKHKNNLKKQTSEANKVKTVDKVQIQTQTEAKDKASLNESKEKTTKNPIDLYSILNHHFKKIDKALLKCLVCNIYIGNSSTHALNHAAESKHKDAYNEILSSNLLFESDTALFFCGVCDCLIPGKGELLHVFGSSHIKNRTKLTNKESCELCNVKAPMKEHMYTMQHISNVKEQQKFLHYCTKCGLLITRTVIGQHLKNCAKIRVNKLVVKDKFCFCIICDLYFTRELVEEHVASSHHQLMFNMSRAWGQPS